MRALQRTAICLPVILACSIAQAATVPPPGTIDPNGNLVACAPPAVPPPGSCMRVDERFEFTELYATHPIYNDTIIDLETVITWSDLHEINLPDAQTFLRLDSMVDGFVINPTSGFSSSGGQWIYWDSFVQDCSPLCTTEFSSSGSDHVAFKVYTEVYPSDGVDSLRVGIAAFYAGPHTQRPIVPADGLRIDSFTLRAFANVPVPEPATGLLFGAGMLIVAAAVWRRLPGSAQSPLDAVREVLIGSPDGEGSSRRARRLRGLDRALLAQRSGAREVRRGLPLGDARGERARVSRDRGALAGGRAAR
jgi:hypothetical protein